MVTTRYGWYSPTPIGPGNYLMNILIADDELHARARLRSLIEEIGPPYRVVDEVITGIEVVAACDAR